MRLASSLICVLALLSSCAATNSAQQTDTRRSLVNNVTLQLGQRFMTDDDWGPLDEQNTFALEYDSFSDFAPLGFELGAAYAEDSKEVSGSDLQSDVWEVYAGVRKTFSMAGNRLQPYLSAGLSYSWAELDADVGGGGGTVTLDDDSIGMYLRGGIYYTLGGGFNLGLDYRHLLIAEYKDDGAKVDGDFGQVSLGIGYSF